tara:strand:- start:645 stop:1004 length:360 start_codon:yes stop_codon:yes gene_type:complete
MIFDLCVPAFTYFLLMLTVIIIDLYNNQYNLAILKASGTILIVYMLELICKTKYTILSYIFVFFPLIITMISVLYLQNYSSYLTRVHSKPDKIEQYLYDQYNFYHGYESFSNNILKNIL